MLKTFIVAALLVAPSLTETVAKASKPTDAERARWTVKDMNDWATVLQAYHKDNNRFPEAGTFAELITQVQPVYIRVAPTRDAWGTAYRYSVSADGVSCSLVSAGSDGKFEAAPSVEPLRLTDLADDAVVKDGKLLRGWEFR